ncbi:precorrin-6y C5,15-methyltransferase (decarboxylating) subunit CbiE [Allostreptomyces psammosilenae]|uniref:Precorrin-6Y C5,15-methyltransferase (Decarboxylating) n=1 Tax=Allostreptomyces psammosilenae TaxID=1892865 RepID=A0A852ZNT3_9ACTN|nr:precorrin-6y C5,15-methyltransferase (decarboxylating) subunit CbiE [Allostreptomyces psammosilenae]NYI04053.1 precorrin-6Y C5,15-methyltransferase (decarboxylating) [Allostreptomyces psammosilenae]
MADRVVVVGWDGSPLSDAARAALASATLVIGARRHLDSVPLPPNAARELPGSLEDTARRAAAHRGSPVVLTAGDPGFFGIVRALRRPEFGLEVEVVPAVSSVAAAFARAGMPWDDALVVNAAGGNLRRAVNVCRAHPKVAVLTGAGAGPAELALLLRDLPRTFVVCEALGTPEETVSVLTADRVADGSWREPNIVLVTGLPPRIRAGAGPGSPAALPGPATGVRGPATGGTVPAVLGRDAPALGSGTGGTAPYGWIAGHPVDHPGAVRGWALPEQRYLHRDSVVLNAEVRALALARLGPRPGDLLWDVGAGSGSLSVEAARFGAAVVAVDRDAAACEAVTANAGAHGVEVQVVRGEAPAALARLPQPDTVFVAAGGPTVVSACLARRPERLVAVVTAVQWVERIREAFAEHGYACDGVLLQASRLAPLAGGVHRFAAAGPTFMLWGSPGRAEPARG